MTLLHADEIGSGFPLLVIHGWECSGRVEQLDFEPALAPVTTKTPLRRIYVDLPGMGRSPADGVRNLDDMFRRLCDLIDARIGTGPFAVAGTSCGGYLARAVAQRYATQVAGLLLRVPVGEPDKTRRDTDAFAPVVSDATALTEEDKKVLGGKVLVQTPAYVAALRAKVEGVYNTALEAADQPLLEEIFADPERYRLSREVLDEEKKFGAPALVLLGRQDEVVGYRDCVRLLEVYTRSTMAVLDRGTHALPVDEGGLFGELVRDWVVRVEEWRGRGM